MGDHVGKSVRLAQGGAGADAGHIGEIRGIHSEPFFSVGVGDGVAYVPASYLDVDYAADSPQPGADSWDNDAGENEPVGTADADPSSEPATAARVLAPQEVMSMFVEWRQRHRR